MPGFHINEVTLCGCEIETYVVFEKMIVWATGCPKVQILKFFYKKRPKMRFFKLIFALWASLPLAGFHINEATLCGYEIETYVVFEKMIV